jgi:hypothetical protein
MVKIAKDLARASELIRTFTGDGWNHKISHADRDALVWLLEVADRENAYIRSLTFRDVVAAAYQMGYQEALRKIKQAQVADEDQKIGRVQPV